MLNLVICLLFLTAIVSEDPLSVLATQQDEGDYLQIHHTEIYKYSDFIHQYFTLPSTDGSKNLAANTNILVAFVKPNTDCFHHVLNSAPLRASQRVTGINAHASVTVIDISFPPSILSLDSIHNNDPNNEQENCGQISFYSFGATITSPKSITTNFTNEGLIPWINEQMRVPTLTFINHFDYPIQVYWMDESKESVFQGILHRKFDQMNIGTTLGHIFIARKMNDVNQQWDPINPIVDYMSVKEPIIIFSPTNRLQTCENDSFKKFHHHHTNTSINTTNSTTNTTTASIMNGVHENQYYGRFAQEVISCDNLEKRFFEFSQNIFYEQRQGLNYFQPKIVRPVTANGFEKRRLPESTYAWLKQWYDEQRIIEEEVEGSSGPCMNQNVAPSGITHLTPVLKDKLSGELRDTLEGWFGGPLILTSIYGVRKYTNNSVLRMHVDTVNTHVVSAIINVDQNVTTDWSLIILNHEGQEQRVNMQAGDMVLYESARLLHGRPEPMNGEHYDNIFIHYMPVSGWNYDWI